MDRVHPFPRDDVLALRRTVEAGLEVRLDRLHLLPERIHVDHEVLEDRQVPHRRHDGHVPVGGDVRDAGLAGEHGAPVDPHPA